MIINGNILTFYVSTVFTIFMLKLFGLTSIPWYFVTIPVGAPFVILLIFVIGMYILKVVNPKKFDSVIEKLEELIIKEEK